MNPTDPVFFPCTAMQAGNRTLAFHLQVADASRNRNTLVCSDTASGENEILIGARQKNGTENGPAAGTNLGALSSCVHDDTVYLTFTRMRGPNRTVCLLRYRNGNVAGPYELTPYGKVDNPSAAIHRGNVHVAWEVYGEKTAIAHASLDLSEPLSDDRCRRAGNEALPATEADANAYRPRLCSNGNALLLAYECFAEGRYRIRVRILEKDGFSAAHEVGTPAKNDQEPWLTPAGDGFLLSFENSSPLYKNYVWMNPRGDRVIIPAFGHGWRVETKQYVKRLRVDDGRLMVSILPESSPAADENFHPHAGSEGRVVVDEKESSGCPVALTVDADTFILLFCEMTKNIWHVHYAVCRNGQWSEAEDTGLVQKQRVPPAAVYDPATSKLTVLASDPDTFAARTITRTIPPQGTRTHQRAETSPVPAPVYLPRDRAAERQTITEDGRKLTLFWGDLHMHSNLSACSRHPKFHCVELEEKFRQCRDVGRLDFALCTDHDSMSDHEWARTKAEAEFHNRPGRFTAFQGFEWTATHGTYPKQGHYNVLYRDTGRLYRVAEKDGNHIRTLWKDMTEGDVLTIPHHPADQTHPLDWSHFDPRFEPLVEIFQVRGSYEYPGNSMDPARYRPQGMVPGLSILDALESGLEFGFTAGGEHEGVGTTAVFAEANTREALFEALRKRHVYGTTGDHMFLEFRVNGVLMGGEIPSEPDIPEISLTFRGTAPVRELRIMRDGKRIFCRSYATKDVDLSWKDEEFPRLRNQRDTQYYYVVVEQENDEIAWASPVFLKHRKVGGTYA